MGDDSQPSWDALAAAKLDGATVLVGLTHEEPAGDWTEQFFGTVMSADPDDGIVLRLEDSRAGDLVTLPPHLPNFQPAAPGRYRLKKSGDVVTDPDFTAIWAIGRQPD